MNELIDLCADFIKTFTVPIDYTQLTNQLKLITQKNYSLHNIPYEPDIRFEDIATFGTCGKVLNQSKTIVFNKKRIETILNLNIDCFDEKHLDNLWAFYNSYDNSSSHNEYQKCLYDFMQKYISLNVTEYFAQMGSFKNIPFELIETLLHENQHVFQKYFWTLFLNGEVEPNEKNAIMIFTMTFTSIFNQLKNRNIETNYARQNHIFPVEFDARYTAMHILSQLQVKHFKNNTTFNQGLKNSNIIPQDFDIEATADSIFSDYLMIYEKYQELSPDDYLSEHEFICKHKETIINEIKRRYHEMLSICSACNIDEKGN